MNRLAACLLCLASLAAAASAAAPSEITAEYKLSSAGLTIGHMKETFVRNGETYRIVSVTRAEGVLKLVLDDQIVLSSTGRIVAEGLQPLAFSQRRTREPSRDVEATFDWERGIMLSTFEGRQSEVPLPRLTQDRLSLMYQFMNLDRGDGTVVLPMSNGRKVELYTYRFVSEERVPTPAGEFDTLHYQRVTQGPKESRAEVWLAKDRFNLPVKVVLDDPKGLRIEQSLVALQAR